MHEQMTNNVDSVAFYQKLAKILINEILPRAKKCNQTVEEFIPDDVAVMLARMELEGHFTRKDVRMILDLAVDVKTCPLSQLNLDKYQKHFGVKEN
jgi:hypothetical protein